MKIINDNTRPSYHCITFSFSADKLMFVNLMFLFLSSSNQSMLTLFILISITKCNIYILDKMYQLLVSIAKLVDSKIMKVKTAVKFVRLVGGNL